MNKNTSKVNEIYNRFELLHLKKNNNSEHEEWLKLVDIVVELDIQIESIYNEFKNLKR